jgi:hypothetical protein
MVLTANFISSNTSVAEPSTSHSLKEMPAAVTLHKVVAIPTVYRGRAALKVEFTDEANVSPPGVDLQIDMPTFVLIPTAFENGTIEVNVLGRLNGKGLPDARAFIGLAYRIVEDNEHFESIYLRPLNGRKINPPSPRERRAIQYFAYPDWKFDRLRKEYPDGRYESGADIADDEWIALGLVVDGPQVRVFVNGTEELTVSDNKASPSIGGIGLWVGRGTEGYFSDLRITPTR